MFGCLEYLISSATSPQAPLPVQAPGDDRPPKAMVDYVDNSPYCRSYNHPKGVVYRKQKQERRRQDDARMDQSVELASIPTLLRTALCTGQVYIPTVGGWQGKLAVLSI